uniref:Uncharacterized protein n=1 Tax=Meloidogyne enterolobii TaxID=390850 RepID=A0A6V7XI21_MELEN|nr:unnamed protein product [Meloidogyne enterolobii]
MEELKNFKPIDLYEKLRLSDNDFDAWRKFRHQAGNNTETYKSYLPEFMWRKRFGNIENVFYNFWHHVSLFYPCERNE